MLRSLSCRPRRAESPTWRCGERVVTTDGAAMTLASELEMRPLVAHCHLGLGRLSRRTGKPEQAQERPGGAG